MDDEQVLQGPAAFDGDGQAATEVLDDEQAAAARSFAEPEAGQADVLVPEDLIQDLGNIFKLLADETRLRILFYLTRRGELHVRALCDLLGQSQPAVSHHLAMLRTAGMIEPRRDGKHNFYRVLPESFEHLVDLVFEAVPHSGNRIRFDSYELSYRRPNQPR